VSTAGRGEYCPQFAWLKSPARNTAGSRIAEYSMRISAEACMRRLIYSLIIVFAGAGTAAAEPPLEIDHLLIYSKPGAPERAALVNAGFVISPDVNHHDGQGTSSVTVEFANGYFELLYPDPAVSVSPNMASVAQLFRDRSNWRTTGLSPFGLQYRRTPSTPAEFPFPTVKVHSDWMSAGQTLELLTPRDMTKALGLLITPAPVSEAENAKLALDPEKGKRFLHPNGVRRISAVEIIAPSPDALPAAAASYVSQATPTTFAVGSEWLMILTLDGGRQHKSRNLEPTLPLVVRY
jgi:hypothetical protein